MRVKRAIAGSAIAGVLFAVVALVAPSTCAEADSTLSAQSEIRSALEKWTIAFNARDSSKVCSVFAPDLISNYQGQPQRNYSSLCDQLKRSVGDPATSYRYALDLQEIIVSGDLAVVRLIWTLTLRREKEPTETTIVEPGLDVFRRQSDGAWKIERFIAYPVTAP